MGLDVHADVCMYYYEGKTKSLIFIIINQAKFLKEKLCGFYDHRHLLICGTV